MSILKEVIFLHRKEEDSNLEHLGIRSKGGEDVVFTEYRSFINPNSINSLSEGYYAGTTDVSYGAWETFLILKGSLDENYMKIYG